VTDTQTTLATFGTRPHTVRVIQRTRGASSTVLLEWRELGVKQRRVVATNDTKRETIASAKAEAKRLNARLVRGEMPHVAPVVTPPDAVTVADVYEAHVALREDGWRPRTRELAADVYRAWAAFAGADTDVSTQGVLTLKAFRKELVRLGREPASATRHLQRVRGFYKSAIEAGVLASHPIASARITTAKDEQAVPVPEFSPDETERLVTHFDPRQRTQWRPWAVMMLAAILGPRANALLHQTRDNLDMGTRTLFWPAHTDKVGKERTQALPRAAVLVLRIVRVWHARESYTGPWLFPSPQWKTQGDRKPWTYAALWLSLGKACDAVGVSREPMQAMHAFRRYAANTVLRATGGDITAVSYWLGDSDLRVLQRSYLRTRDDDGARIAATLNGPRTVPQTPATLTEPQPNTVTTDT
jgi:integrase